MPWKLLLDDERTPQVVHREIDPHPVYLEPGWRIARTVDAALALVEAHGYPDLISFDHDLGMDPATKAELPNGLQLAKLLVARDMDVADMPAAFAYRVHSMNGEGARNIRGLLDDYLAKRTPGVPVPSPW